MWLYNISIRQNVDPMNIFQIFNDHFDYITCEYYVLNC